MNFPAESSSKSILIAGSGLGQQYGSNLSITSSAPTERARSCNGEEGREERRLVPWILLSGDVSLVKEPPNLG